MRCAALAILLAAQAWAGETPRHLGTPAKRGEGVRVASAPMDMGDAPEVVEISGGLVWLVKADGSDSRAATKVHRGFYVSAQGFANLDASVRRETSALRARILELEAAQRAEVPPPIDGALPVIESGPPSRWWVWAIAIGGGVALGYGVARAAR